MTRKITLWRTWEDMDMANSDHFHATKKEAKEHVRAMYEPDDDSVHMERVEITMTKRGIAEALTYIPHR